MAFDEHDKSRPCDWCDSKTSITNLDGDNLCLPCADKWVRAEGEAARREEERGV